MGQSPFSYDGYIIDQSRTKGFPYGHFDSPWNGCGWIAAYNLLKALGREPTAQVVNRQMDALLPHGGFFGTPVRTVARYLSSQGVETGYAVWRKNVLSAAKACRCGILRYLEGREPHFVCFVRDNGDVFRFFNAIEGEERHLATMEDFFALRVKFPYVRMLYDKP